MEGIEQIIAWDQQASLWLNAHGGPLADSFWTFMSMIKVWIPLYVLVAGLLIWRLGWKRGLIAVACIALAFACSEYVNNFIKTVFQRVRPCNDPDMIAAGIHVLEEGGGWSFPSGHSFNSFGFAIASSLCFKAELLGLGRPDTSSSLRRKRLPKGLKLWVNLYSFVIVSWAVLVAISRVMVARHFLLDVCTGSLLGIAMGFAWGKLAQFIFSRVRF